MVIPIVMVKKSRHHYTFYCPYCNKYHRHGNACLGHREAHCTNPLSPYHKTGYMLELKTQKKEKKTD